MRKAFIQTNRKQMFGAQLSKFSLERAMPSGGAIPVEIIAVEEVPTFKRLSESGKTIFRRPYHFDDLQSFTLTRFMPPELMGFTGQAFVIDPDIFAIKNPLPLFSFLKDGAAIAARRKNGKWSTSVMALDCAKLTHWRIEDIVASLVDGTRVYEDYLSLRIENTPITELPEEWNSYDDLKDGTAMLHLTNRITQPWSTGLPIDFTRQKLPKKFGIIPREPILRLLGRYPSRYQPHPDKNIERYFFTLVKDALAAGAITHADIEAEIRAGYIRKDFFQKLEEVS